MDVNKSSEARLNDNELLKKRNLIKGLTLGLGIVGALVLIWLVYMFATNGFGEEPMISYIALIGVPTSWAPLFLILKGLNKEVKLRNLE